MITEFNGKSFDSNEVRDLGDFLNVLDFRGEVEQSEWCYLYAIKNVNGITKLSIEQIAFCIHVAINNAIDQSNDGAILLMASVTSLEKDYQKILEGFDVVKSQGYDVTINTVKRYGDNSGYHKEGIGYYDVYFVMVNVPAEGE